MKDKMQYYVLKEKAVPEVLLATESVGISRSSFYKYKDDIFPFHETTKGKTITMVIQMDDEPGLLSGVLKTIADFHANILTIHQSIPVNGIATLTLSIDILPQTGDVAEMVTKNKNRLAEQNSLHNTKTERQNKNDKSSNYGFWNDRFRCGRGFRHQ